MIRVAGVVATVGLLFAGCGHKKEVKVEKQEMAENRGLSQELAQNDFVFESEGSELAFLDENGATAEAADDYSLSWDDNAARAQAGSEFEPIRFLFDSDKFADGQEEVIARNAERAQEIIARGERLSLSAHCDQIGIPSYNLPLSERRAQAMKQAYVEAGVPADMIDAVGRGQDNPIVFSNATDRLARIKELAPNRRAELSVEQAAPAA